MAFEIANLEKPNSKQNTVNRDNLKLALGHYKCEVEHLQSTKWRDKIFKIFVFGDYAFLCDLYGISGASGKHCCLWCLITQAELKLPLSERGLKEERTLEKLLRDYEKFKENGENIGRAKQYNNAIRPPLLNIPIDQVCLPGLHISIGIFERLYELLTAAFRAFDKDMANFLANRESNKNEQLQKSSLLKQGEGPCIVKLNETLNKLGVQRQAYHGGSFNGNHTNKCLLVRISLMFY
ncbi:uncharacterized protein LOC114576217 [Exaiptasia diaphana]|uniref:Uncharacterized protein n=1 Tax=Exaiptasia diaphana TaxID=2652724 RepID=A0A913YW35_EXADI|nr:uncharacterized protein LOC114576217 [Exaiptasia diaphana]